MLKVTSWILVLSCFTAAAQDPTPNAGFEDWTLITFPTQYEIPDGWDQLNEETNFIGILTCIKTTEAHSGSFAAKLVTKTVTILGQTDTANGIVSTGRLLTVPPYGVTGGIPYAQRPDSIYGWIKYAPTPGDSCQVQFDLFDVNQNLVGQALYKTSQAIGTYTRFSAPVVYFSASNPDTSRWLISASNGFNSLPNSTLYVDDIGLVVSIGLDEIKLADFISVFPNPADEVLTVTGEKAGGGNLRLSDMAGRIIRQWDRPADQETLYVGDLVPGLYVITWMAPHPLASGKIIIR